MIKNDNFSDFAKKMAAAAAVQLVIRVYAMWAITLFEIKEFFLSFLYYMIFFQVALLFLESLTVGSYEQKINKKKGNKNKGGRVFFWEKKYETGTARHSCISLNNTYILFT